MKGETINWSTKSKKAITMATAAGLAAGGRFNSIRHVSIRRSRNAALRIWAETDICFRRFRKESAILASTSCQPHTRGIRMKRRVAKASVIIDVGECDTLTNGLTHETMSKSKIR